MTEERFCPRCKARTVTTADFIICRNIGCPWFLSLADGVEHYRDRNR